MRSEHGGFEWQVRCSGDREAERIGRRRQGGRRPFVERTSARVSPYETTLRCVCAPPQSHGRRTPTSGGSWEPGSPCSMLLPAVAKRIGRRNEGRCFVIGCKEYRAKQTHTSASLRFLRTLASRRCDGIKEGVAENLVSAERGRRRPLGGSVQGRYVSPQIQHGEKGTVELQMVGNCKDGRTTFPGNPAATLSFYFR